MKSGNASTPNFRRHWRLAPGVAFLNHGSFGACPVPVLKFQTELRRRMEAEPIQFLWRHYEELLEPARGSLARFVGARPRDLAFIGNATTGVNAVLHSLQFRPGDELLTTNQDYNACRNALVETARRSGARLVIAQIPFPLRSNDQIIETILAATTKRTRLALIDHVTSATAIILPVAKLIREMDARGVPVLVDGAHAPGMVPLNLSSLRPAYYTGNLHKWVCAPKGAAFLWVREDLQAAMQAPVVSHGYNMPRPGYSGFQDRFDWCGTFDPSAWFAVPEAIRWMESALPSGWKDVRDSNRRLVITARRLLCERLQVEPPCPESFLGSMATIPLPEALQGRGRAGKLDAEQLWLYDRSRIEVPFLRIGNPPRRYFRISAQIYNTIGEYARLADAMGVLGTTDFSAHFGTPVSALVITHKCGCLASVQLLRPST